MPKKSYTKGNSAGGGMSKSMSSGKSMKGGGAASNAGQIKGGNKSVVKGSPPSGWRTAKG
tara:strand:- start:4066 stop:4245 length:180 start_codon:yes stop_codon:yes gene_type:complete